MSDAPLPFSLRKIGHVVLNVTDREISVRFYTELLGLAHWICYPLSLIHPPNGNATHGT